MHDAETEVPRMSIPIGTRVGERNVSSIDVSSTVREQDVMVPRGAIAFFVAMLVAFGVIWLGMYEILAIRQSGL
jgi:hypothetical protein